MNRDELLRAMDECIATEEKPRAITIRGLGTVYIREMKIREMSAYIKETESKDDEMGTESKDDEMGLARGACRLLCDEHGKRLLDPKNEEHVLKMSELPIRALRAINASQEADEEIKQGN